MAKQLRQKRKITLVASFVFAGLLTVVLTTSITLAAFGFGNSIIGQTSNQFGSILINDIGEEFSLRDSLNSAVIDRIRPGQQAKVNFDLRNIGSAGMHVRFRLVLEDMAVENKVDTSIFTVTVHEAFNTVATQRNEVPFVLVDFDQLLPQGQRTGTPDRWFVRRNHAPGNASLNTSGVTRPVDKVVLNIDFDGEQMTDAYKNAQIGVTLQVQVVQAANNGTQRDPALPGYDVVFRA